MVAAGCCVCTTPINIWPVTELRICVSVFASFSHLGTRKCIAQHTLLVPVHTNLANFLCLDVCPCTVPICLRLFDIWALRLPPFHSIADPDPAFHFDAEPCPDPAFHCDANPDLDPVFQYDVEPGGFGSRSTTMIFVTKYGYRTYIVHSKTPANIQLVYSVV
jgi:hypothetical protein